MNAFLDCTGCWGTSSVPAVILQIGQGIERCFITRFAVKESHSWGDNGGIVQLWDGEVGAFDAEPQKIKRLSLHTDVLDS